VQKKRSGAFLIGNFGGRALGSALRVIGEAIAGLSL
jgi:hypothetical protein